MFAYVGRLADAYLDAYREDNSNSAPHVVAPALVDRVMFTSLMIEKRSDRFQRTFLRDGAYEETKIEHLNVSGGFPRPEDLVLDQMLEAWGPPLVGAMKRRVAAVKSFLEKDLLEFNERLKAEYPADEKADDPNMDYDAMSKRN